MATLAIQTIGITGATPAYVSAAGGGDKVVPGQGSFIHVKNGSGGSITVTIATPELVDGDLAVADRAVAVAGGAEAMISIPGRYAAPSDGLAAVTYSAVTSLTIGSFRGPVNA